MRGEVMNNEISYFDLPSTIIFSQKYTCRCGRTYGKLLQGQRCDFCNSTVRYVPKEENESMVSEYGQPLQRLQGQI